MKNLAFVIEDLAANQLAYSLIYNANQWLESNLDGTVSIFYMDNLIPCILPKFPRYQATDIIPFDGTLVATSFKTANLIKKATRARRYYYLNDLEWKRNWTDCTIDKILDIVDNNDIGLIGRSESHISEIPIPKKGFRIIEDYDVTQFMEL
jgi:hypothetical protein